jgi:glutamate/tyrosine decarboxylase-like PLP-dependent enzyme
MRYLGEDGYLRLARIVRDTTNKLRDGINALPPLQVIADPVMSVMSFGSEELDIGAVGDVMDDRGWHLDRQQGPDALHMMVSPEHAGAADAFLKDLADAVKAHGPSRGVEPRYS